MKQTRHSFLKSQKYTSINLKKTNTNHYQIKASINDIEGVFILDTGASNTCADLTQLEKGPYIIKEEYHFAKQKESFQVVSGGKYIRELISIEAVLSRPIPN